MYTIELKEDGVTVWAMSGDLNISRIVSYPASVVRAVRQFLEGKREVVTVIIVQEAGYASLGAPDGG